MILLNLSIYLRTKLRFLQEQISTINIWHRLATDFKPTNLDNFIQQEVTLQQLPDVLSILLKGQAKGRILVSL
ncbi:hypothetical protein J6TS1_17990 [Siminovitchia terrae]|uniref:Uncharacterized protein n=1 Tax=Siminovitchia terrae TaxID=1914933 RepID=A0ABQ4KVA3_SIMTE|nr:hypothetical protein J22TS1_47590 [Siminovitchia terrae]GIN95929.1 hypothetical protein J6TS1_17990 [Siminovitchia terrae]